MPLNFVPGDFADLAVPIEEGFQRAGNGKGWDDFEVTASVSVEVTDDIEGALARHKPRVALYVGGMGARQRRELTGPGSISAGWPWPAGCQ